MSFDSNSSTHIANYVTIVEDVNITLHSKSCGYPLFRITDKITNEEYSLGIMIEDWNTYFKIPIDDVKVCQLSEQKESHFYACLTKEVLEDLVKIKATYIETYVAQRMIFGDEVPTPRKRLEFEIGYQLISKLSDLLVFKHQEKILNYQADILVELKNNRNRDIPSIVIEIDEDGHNDRVPAMEQFRQNVIEYFNNRFIRIPVNRNASQEEINKIVIDTERRIRDLSKELTLDYTVDVDEDDFIKQLEDHNIDKDFIKKFLNGDSGDKVFKYTHQEIGEFLGYTKGTNNYERLRHTIKGTVNNPSVFVEGIDWKPAPALMLEQVSKNDKNDKNLGGAGHNKVTYLITRTTFNRICINAQNKPKAKQIAHYFAVVYEVAVAYAQRLRAKNINSNMNTTEKHQQVKERINELVTQKVKKTNMYKMTTELEEMKNKLEEMTRERDDYKEQTIQQQISLNDLRKKLDTLHQLDSEKTHELEKLNKLYKKKDGISNLEKAIEYINIEIKRKKWKEYTSGESGSDNEESKDVKVETKTVAKVETNVEKPKTVKVVTKAKADPKVEKLKEVKVVTKVEKPKVVKPKEVKVVSKVVKPKEVKVDPKVEPIVLKPKEVKALKPKSAKADTKVVVEPIVVEPIVVEPIVVEPIVVEPIVVEPIVPKYTLANLKKKTIPELKEICRSNKIGGYSSKKKDDLITFMLAQKNI